MDMWSLTLGPMGAHNYQKNVLGFSSNHEKVLFLFSVFVCVFGPLWAHMGPGVGDHLSIAQGATRIWAHMGPYGPQGGGRLVHCSGCHQDLAFSMIFDDFTFILFILSVSLFVFQCFVSTCSVLLGSYGPIWAPGWGTTCPLLKVPSGFGPYRAYRSLWALWALGPSPS